MSINLPTKTSMKTQVAQLRGEAQAELDAASGESIAAKDAGKAHAKATDTYAKAVAAGAVHASEAYNVRAEAKERLAKAVGPRGLFGLKNVARGFMQLVGTLTGVKTPTTLDLVKDPTAKTIIAGLLKRAEGLDAKAADQVTIAMNAHKEAAEALASIVGHETSARMHKDAADGLVSKANSLAKRAEQWPEDTSVMARDLETALSVGQQRESNWGGAVGALKLGLPAPKIEKIRADEPIPDAPSFEPGKVGFGGAARAAVKLPAPNIEEAPKGEKRPSESLVATRWAAEAAGIDWTKFVSTGDLKRAVQDAPGGLHTKNGASPFEVKKRLSERLGLSTSSEAIHKLDLATVRAEFAKRDALGLPRLASKSDIAATGIEANATLESTAMFAMSTASYALKDAATALKGAPNDAAAKAAFDKAAAKLDGAKRVMLEVLKASPDRTLALDTVDAMEVGHGKMGATTKLGFALEELTKNAKFADALKKGLGLDDKGLKGAVNNALQASEWTTLGEMVAPSSVLAFPGALSGEQRSIIGKLPAEGTKLAKELGLLDGASLTALSEHLTFKGREAPGAQILGVVRMLSSLSTRRDFRTKELLNANEIHEELMKNARPPDPKVDARLVSFLQPVLADAVAELRS